MSQEVREQLASRRANARSNNIVPPKSMTSTIAGSSRGKAGDGLLEDRTVQGQIRKATRSGTQQASFLYALVSHTKMRAECFCRKA